MSSNSNYKVWHNFSDSYTMEYQATIKNHEVEEYLKYKAFSDSASL